MSRFNLFKLRGLLVATVAAWAVFGSAQTPAPEFTANNVVWKTVNSPSLDSFLPPKLKSAERGVAWTNTTGNPVEFDDGELTLSSEDGSSWTTIPFIHPTPSWNGNTTNILQFKLPDAPPNTYRGQLVLQKGGKVVGRTAVVWSVRATPAWALVVLVVGLIAARLMVKPKEENSTEPAARFARTTMGVATKPGDSVSGLAVLAQAFVYFALLITGFASLYLSSDTFGAGGLSDYLPLLFWGFGADVGNKTVWNVLRSPTTP